MAERELTDIELLEAAARALNSFTLRSLTIKPNLDTAYRDDPRWTPWTRWLEPEARRAHDLARMIRKRLATDGIRVHGPSGAVPGLWPDLPVYSLAEIRQGTGWPPGAQFIHINQPEREDPS